MGLGEAARVPPYEARPSRTLPAVLAQFRRSEESSAEGWAASRMLWRSRRALPSRYLVRVGVGVGVGVGVEVGVGVWVGDWGLGLGSGVRGRVRVRVGVGVELPGAHAAEVRLVLLSGQGVELLEEAAHVTPVLLRARLRVRVRVRVNT